MSFSIADFILNVDSEYNGHKQLDFNISLSITEILELCEELREKLEETENFKGFVSYKVFSDGSGSIVAEDYWERGEHHLGHTDKTLLGVGVKLNKGE